MISYELFCQIRQLADQQQLNATQIAAKLHLDGKTVAKWIARPNYQQRQKVKRPSKLPDPHVIFLKGKKTHFRRNFCIAMI